MEAAPETLTPAQLETLKMTKIQRLAAFLILLEPEGSAAILKRLEPQELEAVTAEMTRLPLISQAAQIEILREFSSVALQASTSVCGGRQPAQAVLEKAVGPQRAAELLQRLSPLSATAALEPVVAMDARALANLLKHEQPQTIALVTSYLTPDKAAAVLRHLPSELRELALERLATLSPTPLTVVDRVAQMLIQKAGATPGMLGEASLGGVKPTAEILNALDRESSGAFLTKLADRNPELMEAIRAQMFTFADLKCLDSSILQGIMREVDLRDLALALKNADAELKKKLLSCISKRAAESVEEEINFLGAVKPKEIEAARARIIEALRRLEAEGEVDLAEALQNARHEALA